MRVSRRDVFMVTGGFAGAVVLARSYSSNSPGDTMATRLTGRFGYACTGFCGGAAASFLFWELFPVFLVVGSITTSLHLYTNRSNTPDTKNSDV